MSLENRIVPSEYFPDYDRVFAGAVVAERQLEEPIIGVTGLAAYMDLHARVAPLLAEADALRRTTLTEAEHGRMMAFGGQVLGDILDISSQAGLVQLGDERPRPEYQSNPIRLTGAPNPAWHLAQTYLYVMSSPTLSVDELDLGALREDPRERRDNETGSNSWVWGFGMDFHSYDPDAGGKPVVKLRSPLEWFRDTYMNTRSARGQELYELYQVADAVDIVQTHIAE